MDVLDKCALVLMVSGFFLAYLFIARYTTWAKERVQIFRAESTPEPNLFWAKVGLVLNLAGLLMTVTVRIF